MNDPYTDENGVLLNKLGITDYYELSEAEADIGFVKIMNVDSLNVDCFDEELLKKIHKHIFEDIFNWAGEYRRVPIIKEELVLPGCSVEYSRYQEISKDLKKCLIDLNSTSWKNMDIIAPLFARKLALLWKVHPFRDGNTRTVLSFAYLYAKEYGFPFDIGIFTEELFRGVAAEGKTIYNIRDKFVLACLDEEDYPEVQYLANVFERAILHHNINNSRRVK